MNRFIMLVLSVFICALMASCDGNGGVDDGGDSTEKIFNTVRAYAAYDTEAYTADVGEGEEDDEEGDPGEDDECDDYYYYEDEVSVTVSSIAINNLPMDPSPLKLVNYTVRFIPLEDSPAIPSKTLYHDIEILPGSSTTIPIRIIDQEDKSWNSSHPLSHWDYCNWRIATGDVSWEYTIEVQLRIVEILTGTSETIELDFPLYYFDVADDCGSTCNPD
jgi:hypothetical protein